MKSTVCTLTVMTALDLHAPNPMHCASGPNDTWSTVNTRENYAGVMSPLGATLWLPICDRAVNGSFHDIGVLSSDQIDAPAPEPSSAVFYGRYTAGISYFRRLADLIPGQSGASFEEQFFASTRTDEPEGATRRRYPMIAAKAPAQVARLKWRAQKTFARTETWWRRATTVTAAARPAQVQLDEAFTMLHDVMRVHMVVCFVAQGVFDGLGKLADKAGRPGLHLQLATGYGQMAEVELVAMLDRVAHGEATLDRFLSQYGFRCAGELEVSNPTWRERPELIERLVAKYRSVPQRPDYTAQGKARAEVREAAERELLVELPAVRRPSAKGLLILAKAFIPMREEGKANLARAFDGTRVACRARGREMAAAGVIDTEDDVFYLTVDEIQGTPPADARELVAARRELRTAYEKFDVPEHWVGQPVPIAISTEAVAPESTVTGTAAAHGVVEGRARVLAGADESDLLEPDEILVCHTTDPSWASAFHLAAGVVIDVGSISSHGAIVAREMGLPCVIGTGNGTAVLRTGDLLRVDGGAGIVTVLETASA